MSLSLPGVGIAGAVDAAVLAPFTALEKLDLSGNQITSFSAANRSGKLILSLYLQICLNSYIK